MFGTYSLIVFVCTYKHEKGFGLLRVFVLFGRCAIAQPYPDCGRRIQANGAFPQSRVVIADHQWLFRGTALAIGGGDAAHTFHRYAPAG